MAIESASTEINNDSINGIPILHKGLELDSRYVIEELIGSGGMAAVYSAYDKNLKTRVAIKVLDQQHSSEKEFIARFYREAQAAAKLQDHPGITRVTDVGEFKERLCIVMELIEGRDLEKIISEKNTLPEEEAVNITCKVLDTLAYAHSRGIIHRDIKPGNIMITQSGHVKITDFGIAKIIDKEGMPAQTKLTQDINRMMGSIEYISPEQIRNNNPGGITEKTDVFSTGVMLYHMLTGASPYDYLHSVDRSTQETTLAITNSSSLKKRHKNLSAKLENIILKAIDKNPEKRYTAEEFRDALHHYISGEKVKVEGTLKRKYELNRRKFLSLGFTGIIGLAAAISIPRILTNNHNNYMKSIYSTIDKIQQAHISSMQDLSPFLRELYPKLIDRLLWIHDVELKKRIESERKKVESHELAHPEIYPFTSLLSGDRIGRYAYLNGESSYAADIIPIPYLLFEELDNKANIVIDKKIKVSLTNESKILLDSFFYYAAQLYFAEGYKKPQLNENDDARLLVDRFFPGFERVAFNLRNNHPDLFAEKREIINIIINNNAKAIKIVIEKRYNPAKGFIESFDFNKYDVSAYRDDQIAEFLCNSFRLIDLQQDVLIKYRDYGNNVKSTREYLDIIVKDADTKIKALSRSNAWLQKTTSKEYVELLIGLTHRYNLLEDILQKKDKVYENDPLFAKNISEIYKNNPNQVREYEIFLMNKIKEYRVIISSMTNKYMQQFPEGSIPNFYFEPRDINPTDTGTAVFFLKAIQLQRKNDLPQAETSRLIQFTAACLKNILTKINMAQQNYLPVSEDQPLGILKGNIVEIGNNSTTGGTQPRVDYMLTEIIRLNK